MSDNKKYYYLKLKDNFFDSEEIIILQNMQDGYLYSDILFKMYLRSLKNEGLLMFNNFIPYDANILSQIVRHSVGVVEKAIKLFKQLSLIEIMDNGAIYMLNIQNYIGNSSTEADRQREYQNRIKSASIIPCKKSNKETYIKPTPEIEKEIELKKEIEIDIQINSNFEIFWNLYDKRINRTKSFIKWKKIKPDTYPIIFDHVERYVKSTPDKQYRKNPETYLNNQCWNDEILSRDSAPKQSLKEKAESLDYLFSEKKSI